MENLDELELGLYPSNASSANNLREQGRASPVSTRILLDRPQLEQTKNTFKREKDTANDDIVTPERIVKQLDYSDGDDMSTPERETNVNDSFNNEVPINPDHTAESIRNTNVHYDNVEGEGIIPPDFFAELNPLKIETDSDTLDEDELKREYVKIKREIQSLQNMHESIDDDKPQCSKHSNSRDNSTSESRRKHRQSGSKSSHRYHEKHSESSKDRRRRRSSSRKLSKRSRRSRSLSSDIEPLRVPPDQLPRFKPIQLDRLKTAPKTSSKIAPAECETLEMKRQRGIARAEAQLKAFENRRRSAGTFSQFIYTNTVYNIPKKGSLLNKPTGENRSPLSVNNNVIFGLTSMGARVDLVQYGLQQPPQPIVDLLNVVGLDVHKLEARRAKSKMPPKLLKLMNEESGLDEGVAVRQSALQSDAQTQTDPKLCRPVSHNKSTQYTDPTLIDISHMNSQQRSSFIEIQQLIQTVPHSVAEELQQGARLIHAFKLAKGSAYRKY